MKITIIYCLGRCIIALINVNSVIIQIDNIYRVKVVGNKILIKLIKIVVALTNSTSIIKVTLIFVKNAI